MNIAVIYHSVSGNTKMQAELVAEGARSVTDIDVKIMSIDKPDNSWIEESHAVIFGCPTYEGSCSWQMKKFLDAPSLDLSGKLGGAFVSQNWPGGGGADLAEITIIAGMLVLGMLVYSGGITVGEPYLHFGAVSARAPEGLFAERCRKLGENIALKAIELFSR